LETQDQHIINLVSNSKRINKKEQFVLHCPHDDYITPKSAWTDIQKYIPKKKIWEAFYGDGKSGTYLKEMGFDVIHEPIDFLKIIKEKLLIIFLFQGFCKGPFIRHV